MTIELDNEMKERLQRIASLRHRSPDLLLRDAVEQYVDREERREKFRQDGLAAWKHFAETGLHLTGDEADVWLARLEAGEDADIPECHV